jgi:methylated-DNA-protein-cysteine methyltransferase-like protein
MGQVYDRVYMLVQRIPSGRVLTYGLISNLMGGNLSAQGVGWALKALPEKPGKGQYSVANVPWHRVINSQGRLSTQRNPNIPPGLQKVLLQKEGIKFDQDDCLDLKKYLWQDF